MSMGVLLKTDKQLVYWIASPEDAPRGAPFVAIDMDSNGYAVGFAVRPQVPPLFAHAHDVAAICALTTVVRESPHRPVIVYEERFAYNVHTIKSTVAGALINGIGLGAIAHGMPDGVSLYGVAAATWQAHLRKKRGVKGTLSRAAGIQLAMDEHTPFMLEDPDRKAFWDTLNKKRREGVASALGIADWWRAQTW